MRREQIKLFLNRRVLLILKNNWKYTGEITALTEDSVIFIDKYDKKMVFCIETIDQILEQ